MLDPTILYLTPTYYTMAKTSAYTLILYNTSLQLMHRMKIIRCVKHRGYKINKCSLSSFGDKLYLLVEGISSYVYGHFKIQM